MEQKRDCDWFMKNIAPQMSLYKLEYRYFEEGDFGTQSQILFDSSNKCGEIDFWDSGWLKIDLYDKDKDCPIIRVLLDDDQVIEKESYWRRFLELL